MENSIIDYIVIFAYLILISSIGVIFKSFNKNSSDYFRGGAQTTWWLLGSSIWISAVSAAVFTGSAGAVFESGLPPLASNWAIIGAGFILALFLAGWFRQLRLITSIEVMRERFGVFTEQIFAYLQLLSSPFYAAFHFFGLAIFVSAVFGFNMQLTIIGLACVIAFYSVSSGKWGVMAADFLQSLILIPVSILVAVLAVMRIGGIGEFVQQSSDAGLLDIVKSAGTFSDNRYTLGWIVAVFIMGFFSQLQLNWSARFFAAKDGREAKKAAWLMVFLFIGGTVLFTVPPMVARLLFSGEVAEVGALLNKPAEASYVVACQQLLPRGLIGLIIVAMFSATTSTMDTGINAVAAVIVRNIIPPIRRLLKKGELSDRGGLFAGRIAALGLIIYITAIALYFSYQEGKGIFEMLLGFASQVGFPIMLPTFLALFFKKAPRCSALISVAGGLILPRILIPVLSQIDGFMMNFQMKVLIVGVSGTVGFFLSYFFRHTDNEAVRQQITAFYTRMHTPVDFAKEVGAGNDRQQMLVVGRLALLVAVLMLGLIFIPNPLWARGCILALSASVGSVGGLLLWGAKKNKNAS